MIINSWIDPLLFWLDATAVKKAAAAEEKEDAGELEEGESHEISIMAPYSCQKPISAAYSIQEKQLQQRRICFL